MNQMSGPCICNEAHDNIGETSLEVFAAIRSQCAALHAVFLPDEVWPDFQKWHSRPDNSAHHRSVLLLALERGHLGRATSAVHRYLISAGSLRPEVRRQYLKDLRERWMHYSDPVERHKKFRIFFGRLVELQCAEWLEQQGWVISGLEALREGPDIEAHTNGGLATALEVKSIGTGDDDFATILESLAGQPAGASVSPYAAANYLLFRAYEAGKQLEGTTGGRIAVLVVEDMTWWRFKLQLKDNWIDWANPKFFPADAVWEGFLARQRTRYPSLSADLQVTIGKLDAVWILRHSYGYQYHREFEVRIGAIR